MELLLGCGNSRTKAIVAEALGVMPGWHSLVTLDNDPNCGADVEHDLSRPERLPFSDDHFDEIHAYHVLEHFGSQGDYQFFFWQWTEFWRILKPGGKFCGITPAPKSIWAYGDPGHCRVIEPAVFTFLNQEEYTKQVGNTAMADYRRFFRGDFVMQAMTPSADGEENYWVLEAIKPSRISV